MFGNSEQLNQIDEGQQKTLVMEVAYDYGDYKMKVNRYVNDHQVTLAIQKLRKNIPLTQTDYQVLEPQAAMDVFSDFIDNQSLNQLQIVFVHKVIDYVIQNGYIENVTELMKPPFDKPQSFGKLFDLSKQQRLVEIVKGIKENAVRIG